MANLPQFEVNRSWNSNNLPYFSRPEVSGYFSIDGNRKFRPDASQLKYLNAPSPSTTVRFDLNKGYDLVKRKPNFDDENLDHLLRWILLNSHKIRAPSETNRWLQPHFIFYRGTMARLWRTPYEKREGWIICACKWRGTIYLCAFDTEEQKSKKASLPEEQLQYMSWGFKFEQYMLTDSPGKAADTTQGVNEAEEFCCLFQSRLGDNRLLYGAEMDGVTAKEVLNEPIDFKGVKFVELKTRRVIENKFQERTFKKFKLIKWWCQCFLAGIDTVICGVRDNDGIVGNLNTYHVTQLNQISQDFWNGSNCMIFGNEFLNFVKSVVKKDHDKCVYKFEWIPGNNVKVEEMDALAAESEYSFLPQWFIDQAEPYDCKLIG